MEPSEYQDLQRTMSQLSDEQLTRIVAVEQADYRKEAVRIAREELRRRGLRELTEEEYRATPEQRAIEATGFCPACLTATTDQSPGSTGTTGFIVIGIGTRLIGMGDPCPTCGSVIQSKYLCLGVPLIPLGRYRIKYLGDGLLGGVLAREYVGRRLIDR